MSASSQPEPLPESGAQAQSGVRAQPGGLRAGYLGPAGTFTEQALLADAPAGALQPIALATIYDTITAVRDGEVEVALVPIENSLDGSVTVTLDLLADRRGGLEIIGETLLDVRHSLIARETIALSEIEVVLSHPQVPGQCTRFLRRELPHAQVRAASSTAEAVRIVTTDGQHGWAALGTSLAAEIYGGVVLREGVQDRDDNTTRFVWLSRVGEQRFRPARAERASKTSLVFWGAGADSPGWLVRCLDEFARRSINLTKIESRPERSRLGHYMFFADLEGGLQERDLADAVAGLRGLCQEVRVLGSYPVA